MTTVNVHEAKTHLSRLLERVERGERIVIARPAVRSRCSRPSMRRHRDRPGRDQIVIHDDFDDPLPDFADYLGAADPAGSDE